MEEQMKILFKNADILFGDDLNIIFKGCLGVENDKIIYVGEELPTEEYDVVKDMSNKLLMPGLVNSHSHAAMTLLRGLGGGFPLQEWLFENIIPVEDKLVGNDIRVGNMLAISEMISSGTVSYSDMYDRPMDQIEAVVSSKMKINICRPVLSFDDSVNPHEDARFIESLWLYDNYHNHDEGRIKIDMGIHAEYTSTENNVREYAKEAIKRNANIHVHVSETIKEHNDCKEKYGKTPTKWLEDLGILDTTNQFAHGVALEDGDLDIIKKRGITVIHNPSSNMKLGSGFARINKMIEMGINVSLGTDGAASNNNLNMFEEMHLAAMIHKGYENDPTILNPKTIIKMATVNGARMQGRFDTGVIKEGFKADIIAIDFNKPHLIPNISYLDSLIYSAQGSDVCMTMIDGNVVYENGEFLTIDINKVYEEVREVTDRLYEVYDGKKR